MPEPATLITTALIANVISAVTTVISSTPAPPPAQVAVTRIIPAKAKVAELRGAVLGAVNIDGKKMRLAPGAQIKNALNILITPNMISRPVKVKYLEDNFGYVSRIWILSPTELAALR